MNSILTSCDNDIGFCTIIKAVDPLWDSKLSDRTGKSKTSQPLDVTLALEVVKEYLCSGVFKLKHIVDFQ